MDYGSIGQAMEGMHSWNSMLLELVYVFSMLSTLVDRIVGSEKHKKVTLFELI
jgi:hypothetical protein